MGRSNVLRVRFGKDSRPIRKRVLKPTPLQQLKAERENRPSRKTREPWFTGMVGNHVQGQLAPQSGIETLHKITLQKGEDILSYIGDQPLAHVNLIWCTKSEAESHRRKIYKANVEGKYQVFTRYYPEGKYGYLQLTRLR